VNKQTDRA